MSATVLALLVALISVLSVTLPIIVRSLAGENSRIVVSKQVIRPDSAIFVVSNSGARPAHIERARIDSIYFPSFSTPRLEIPAAADTAYLPPGSKQIQFPIRFNANTAQIDFYLNLLYELEGQPTSLVGEMEIGIVNFDGSREMISFTLSREELSRILRHHQSLCFRAPAPTPDQCKNGDQLGDGDIEGQGLNRADQVVEIGMRTCLEQARGRRPVTQECLGPRGRADRPLHERERTLPAIDSES